MSRAAEYVKRDDVLAAFADAMREVGQRSDLPHEQRLAMIEGLGVLAPKIRELPDAKPASARGKERSR